MTRKTGSGRSSRSADNAKFTRQALIRSQSFNEGENTVDLVWTTGASVRRFDWYSGDEFEEVLSLEPGAVRLERLNGGAPFLNTHSSWDLADVIGSVVPGSARIDDGKGIATVKLSGAAADADTIGKIRDGVIRNISVGYLVHAFSEAEKDGVTTRTVTDWEPLEISAVPIPADAGAQIRSHRAAKPDAGSKSPRVADIRRMARKAGLPKFGEKHVRLGTSADEFFWLLAERLVTPKPEEMQMAKNDRARSAYENGKREAERLLGRSKRDDDTTIKPVDDDDDDDDDVEEVCASCGRPLDDARDDDDDDSEDRDDEPSDDDDKDRNRSVTLAGRRARTAPTRTAMPASRPSSTSRQTAPFGSKIERPDIDRGAAAARKLIGKR
jgi:HK97 family phage prohead protease